MKRIQYHRYGGPEVLQLEEVEPQAPGRGQLLVRVRAAATNAMDWKIRRGDLRPMTLGRFPRGVGYDFAGVVEAVGEGVTRLHVGDEVLGTSSLRRPGSFAELMIANEKSVVLKPAGLGFVQAAALPVIGLTAHQALFDVGELRGGHSLFVHGCLGGVGSTAAQLAKRRGATVAGSCRPASRDHAAALGIDPVVDFDFDPDLLSHQFDLVLDTAGSLPIRTARTLLRPDGRIIDIVPAARKIVRCTLPGPYSLFMGRPDLDVLDELAAAAASGDLQVPVARTVSLAAAIPALVDLETGNASTRGKLVILPS